MRVKYCCDAKAYENYYLQQTGGSFFSGPRFQKGYGLGNVFSSIGKNFMPLIKTGAKAIGKQFLKSGVGFVSDVLAGKNAKQAAIDQAKKAGTNLLQKVTRKRKRPMKVLKRKRKKT